METTTERIQQALASLEEYLEDSDRSGDPMVYLVEYAIRKLAEALPKEGKGGLNHA